MDLLANIVSHWPSVLAVLLVLGGLIFFHELGHFTVARCFGIGVQTFSLGFGPKILTRRYGKTDYCLSLIPLGGYVSLVGEDDDPDATPDEAKSDNADTSGVAASDAVSASDDASRFGPEEEYSRRPPWQRLLVVLAGPVANFVLAWLLYWGLAWGHGQTFLLPELGKIMPDSPAAAAGLQPGDSIQSIDGVRITRWDQIPEAVAASDGRPVRLDLVRGEERLTVTLAPESSTRADIFGEEKPAWLIGIMPGDKTGVIPLNAAEAAVSGFSQTWNMISFTLQALGKLVTGSVPLDSVGGPILIGQAVAQQAQQSLVGVLLLAALISVNLGILNLLPIPVLDGGHIVFFSLEILLRRPVNTTVRAVSTRVGFALLMGLMVLATWNDVLRFFR